MVKPILLILLISFCIGIPLLQGQQISGIVHTQSGQNIQIVYTLSTTSPVDIRLEVSTDHGKTFSAPLKQVSGDVGKGITAGQKQILWRVLEEVLELVGDGVVFRVSVISTDWRPGTVHCSTPTEIVPVYSPKTGKTWMDRNLGATRVATSPADAAAYGDLYQWGRFADGHQCRNSPTTSILSSINSVGHNKFIVSNFNPNDWRYPQDNNQWQGVNGISNPCPIGFRLPTEAELAQERQTWKIMDSSGAFASALKLPLAGYISFKDGLIYNTSSDGYYWTSSVSNSNAYGLSFSSVKCSLFALCRAYGFTVRCIKD